MSSGGRLQDSTLPSKTAHLLLLSTTSRIVQLLVNNAHISAMRAGPSTVLSNISRDYVIPGVKRLFRKISQTCVVPAVHLVHF